MPLPPKQLGLKRKPPSLPPQTLVARIFPPNPPRGYHAHSFMAFGTRYPKFVAIGRNGKSLWYEVDPAMAAYLKKQTNNQNDPDAKPIFQVVTVAERAALELAEAEARDERPGPIPLPEGLVPAPTTNPVISRAKRPEAPVLPPAELRGTPAAALPEGPAKKSEAQLATEAAEAFMAASAALSNELLQEIEEEEGGEPEDEGIDVQPGDVVLRGAEAEEAAKGLLHEEALEDMLEEAPAEPVAASEAEEAPAAPRPAPVAPQASPKPQPAKSHKAKPGKPPRKV